MKRESLQSRLGFLLLAAGCAVGLGNVWRFPFIVGANGGAAFVLLYLVCLLLIGYPLLTVELAIGRGGKAGVVGALTALAFKRFKPFWHKAGWLVYLGNFLLMMYYSSVTGWLLYYFAKYALTGLPAATPEETGVFFNGMLARPLTCVVSMCVGVAAASCVCAVGVQRGVERVGKWMMLSLFVLLAVLAVRALFLPGAKEGLEFYLKPDFSTVLKHPLQSLFCALGQAFFTLSIGVGCMVILGSYVGQDRSLASESLVIIGLDTLVALLSGLIIFPACFSYHVDVGQGPGLIFVALPNVFAHLPFGRVWGIFFFLFLSLAALTTLVAVFECLTAGLIEEFGLSRSKAAFRVGGLVALLSLPCVFGFNLLKGIQPLGPGSTILDLEDFLFSQFWLPIGALTLTAFCVFTIGWGWQRFRRETRRGTGFGLPKNFRSYMRWILPLIVLAILLGGIIQKFCVR